MGKLLPILFFLASVVLTRRGWGGQTGSTDQRDGGRADPQLDFVSFDFSQEEGLRSMLKSFKNRDEYEMLVLPNKLLCFLHA